MTTVQDIKRALAQLSLDERESIAAWLRLHYFDDVDQARGYEVREPAVAYKVDTQPPYLSVDDYLKFEEGSSIKHEYVAGRIFAMGGATKRHSIITSNLVAALHGHLREGPCQTFVTDVLAHIKINQDDVFYYPDLMVVCNALNLDDRYERNATLIIEVLSPSTETVDRREKAFNYRQMESLQEYVLVAQSKPEVTIHRRTEKWMPQVMEGLGNSAEFRSIALTLQLSQIYEKLPL